LRTARAEANKPRSGGVFTSEGTPMSYQLYVLILTTLAFYLVFFGRV
jgi:hypothetical protein